MSDSFLKNLSTIVSIWGRVRNIPFDVLAWVGVPTVYTRGWIAPNDLSGEGEASPQIRPLPQMLIMI